jgi:N4-gp56 family major capsid protein
MAYGPAGNTTGTASLTHLATVYYKKEALDVLRKKFRFAMAGEPDILPKRSGKTVQFYRYSVFGSNTVPSSEGVIGNSLTLTSTTISATVSEYEDFITLSSLLVDTAIDPIMANAAKELGYRAAISVDTIIRIELDSITSPEILTLGATLTAADFRRAGALLEGVEVSHKEGDHFVGIAHPYVVYDLQSDNTAGGWIDVLKYADPQKLLSAGGRGEVGKVGSTRIWATTNVKTSGTAPNVLYHTYVVGKGALGLIPLAGNAPDYVSDPDNKTFSVNSGQGGPTLADPSGVIGGWVSYRFVFVAKLLDTVTPRYRIIKADASLV